MYRLFLVDDESGQLELMAEIMAEIAPEMEISCFSDPMSALEAMRILPADAILSDIRMPGMDGLTFAGIVRAEYPETIIVMLSAYGEFEYARTAITLGVSDYLLKPTTKKELQRLIGEISLRLELLAESRMNRSELAAAQRHTQLAALRRWLSGIEPTLPADVPSIEAKQALLACWRFFSGGEAPLGLAHGQWDGILSRFTCHLMPTGDGEEPGLALFLLENTAQAEELARALDALAKGNGGGRLFIGLSSPFESVLKCRAELYAQANEMYALTFASSTGWCLWPEKAAAIPLISPGDFDRLEDHVMAAVRKGDPQEVAALLEKFRKAHGGARFLCSRAMAVNRMTHLFVSFFRQLDLREPEEFLSQMARADSFDALCSLIGSHMAAQLRMQRSQLNSGTAGIISDIAQYMESHCEENLSLDSIAERYYFNPSYLSNLFKQYTNVGFKEYLIHVRMEKAKQLLRHSRFKVHKIGALCGYADNSYFVRLFKKQTGLSPGQYRGKGAYE